MGADLRYIWEGITRMHLIHPKVPRSMGSEGPTESAQGAVAQRQALGSHEPPRIVASGSSLNGRRSAFFRSIMAHIVP